MSAPKDGGPAFPANQGGPYQTDGMTLRDYFAAKALVGALSADQIMTGPDGAKVASCRQFAAFSYFMADAMLAERNREAQP